MHCIKAGENRQFESYTVVSCKAEEDLVQDPPGDHPRNTPILSPWGKLKKKKKKCIQRLDFKTLGRLEQPCYTSSPSSPGFQHKNLLCKHHQYQLCLHRRNLSCHHYLTSKIPAETADSTTDL